MSLVKRQDGNYNIIAGGMVIDQAKIEGKWIISLTTGKVIERNWNA